MNSLGAYALVLGGTLSAVAALAHLVCIAVGAPAYRFMGADERMARAVEAGKMQPTMITLAIALMLFVWSAYAFSGAGAITRLPFTKFALLLISATFLIRAVAFPLLKNTFPENSDTFWWVSSGICLVIGLLYAFGLFSLWKPE
jgi:hypothetical protein